MSEIDLNLLAVFEPEQQEHLEAIRALLGQAGGPPLDELLRRAHTLKGAARAVGIASIELLAHGLESLFARVREGRMPLAGTEALIERVTEATEEALAAVLRGEPEPDVSPILGQLRAALGDEPAVPPAVPPVASAPSAGEPRAEMLRVAAASIDELVRSSSLLVAASAAASQDSRGMSDLYGRIMDLDREWSRLRLSAASALRKVANQAEFAPLRESLDLLGQQLRQLAADTRKTYAAQRQHAWRMQGLSAEVHRDARRVRMVPAAGVFDGFRKMVRDLAGEANKEIQFHMEGGDVLADRLVLQQLKDPVMHLLRNAVGHGIEPPGEREQAGKPCAGSVWLRLASSAGRLLVTVEDDGRGLDPRAIAEAAARSGVAVPPQAAPDEIFALLFRPGLTTARDVTTLAGRGMGLGVVEQTAAHLQGTVSAGLRPGGGTVFQIAVPLSISTHHLVLVGCGPHRFGIPAAALEKLCRVAPEGIETVEGRETIRVNGRPVPLVRLGTVLGIPAEAGAEAPRRIPTAVIRVGRDLLALAVESLLDEQRAIVQDLGLAPGSAGMATGGVLLEDGSVAVVLDPARVMQAYQAAGIQPAIRRPAAPATEPPRVLVVDDSITTRALEKSILEAHGYRVRVAVDGLDALAQIRAGRPDLVIADVMMPGMDGFELLERMKGDSQTADIPVIMVTSMENREDQERGLALGADAYIVKRKFDQRDLLETVRQLL